MLIPHCLLRSRTLKRLGNGPVGTGTRRSALQSMTHKITYWRKESSDRLLGHRRLPENTGYQGQNQIQEDPQWESDLAESLRVKTVEEMPARQYLNLTAHMQSTLSPGNCSLPKLVF